MTQDELTLVLEALERSVATCFDQYAHQQVMSQPDHFINQTITSLRQAIAELESQEPVAYINVEKRILEWAKLTSWETPTVVNLPKIPLYTHPPQRTWVGLTDEDLEPLCNEWRIVFGSWTYEFAKAIEAKLKEKNT